MRCSTQKGEGIKRSGRAIYGMCAFHTTKKEGCFDDAFVDVLTKDFTSMNLNFFLVRIISQFAHLLIVPLIFIADRRIQLVEGHDLYAQVFADVSVGG